MNNYWMTNNAIQLTGTSVRSTFAMARTFQLRSTLVLGPGS
jgi:hypothetical protein